MTNQIIKSHRRVVIAHGWADDPTRGWINWLTSELAKQGIEATAPQFPEPKTPSIPAWMATFTAAIGKPDQDLVLVGHSLGCLIVCKYLSELEADPSTPQIKSEGQASSGNIDGGPRIAGIVLVAGMPMTESWRPEGLYPIDFDKVKSAATKRICIYSNDDDKVKPERTKELAQLLDAELINDPGKGHFAGIHGCAKLTSALQAVLSCYTL